MEESFLREHGGDAWRDVSVRLGAHDLKGLRLGYDEVEAGALLLSIGGSGTLEVSVNRGSARRTLSAVAGDPVLVQIPEDA
jgi:S-adenosylmethionine hydrolase